MEDESLSQGCTPEPHTAGRHNTRDIRYCVRKQLCVHGETDSISRLGSALTDNEAGRDRSSWRGGK